MYCPYNQALDCEDNDRHCDRCGWNPDVDARRRPITRAKVLNEPIPEPPKKKETWFIGSGEYKNR